MSDRHGVQLQRFSIPGRLSNSSPESPNFLRPSITPDTVEFYGTSAVGLTEPIPLARPLGNSAGSTRES